MVIKLYYTIASPPARSVILTLKALGLPYELINVNLQEGEQRSEEFLKLNPQHTIPTIQDDDGFVIWESHAINAYLVNKYGKDDKLYTKDPKARAVVDQRLHFDNGVLFISLRNITMQVFYKKTITKMTDALVASIEEGYQFLEKFLARGKYVAGDDITIADFSVITTMANLNILAPIKKDKFPLIAEYLKRCELNIPHSKETNEPGINHYKELLVTRSNFELPTS